jgi:hypothetical protein
MPAGVFAAMARRRFLPLIVVLAIAAGMVAGFGPAHAKDGGGGGGGGDSSGHGSGGGGGDGGKSGGDDDSGDHGGGDDHGGKGSGKSGGGDWDHSGSSDARGAVSQGRALPLRQVLPTVRKAAPGKVLDVDLQQSPQGRLIYKFLVLGRDGTYAEVLVDAAKSRLMDVRKR